MPKVFISYARDESCGQSLAEKTQKQLESQRFEVFRDVTGLKGGDFWLQKLEQELRASEVVVLILSEKVLHSKWVPNEITLAERLNIPVIPIYAELIELPLWLMHLQTLDFSDSTNWPKLFESVFEHVGAPIEAAETDSAVLNENLALDNVDFVAVYEAAKRGGVKVDHEYDLDEDLTPVTLPKAAKRSINYSEDLTPVVLPSAARSRIRTKESDLSWASEIGQDQYGQYADLEINKVTQRFRLIHPGTFQMGSLESEKERRNNETLHQVTLSEDFWLADTACTQALWLAVMGNNPSRFTDNKNNPVEQVSWNDIHEFIQALSQLKSGVTFQLPTEAQWEYACRAETTTPFSFGEKMTSEQVNYNGEYPYNKGFFQKKDLYRGKTLAVQSLPANQWGLYEMHGNVLEWCRDAYSALSSEACTDPYNPSGDDRVLRGGSWIFDGGDCRSAIRYDSRPGDRDIIIGFRFALVN